MGQSVSTGECLTITLITVREQAYATRHRTLEVLGHAFLSEMDLYFEERLVATSHQCTLSILSSEFRVSQAQRILTSRNGAIFYFLKCLLSLHIGAPLTASLPAVITSSVIQIPMGSKQNSDFCVS